MPLSAAVITHTPRTTPAPTGPLLVGYAVVLGVTAIGTNLETCWPEACSGGRSPQVSVTAPAGELVIWAAVLGWSWLTLVTGAVRRAWWAMSPLGIVAAVCALRVSIVGFDPGDVPGLLIAPGLITIGTLTGYAQGRTTVPPPGGPEAGESARG